MWGFCDTPILLQSTTTMIWQQVHVYTYAFFPWFFLFTKRNYYWLSEPAKRSGSWHHSFCWNSKSWGATSTSTSFSVEWSSSKFLCQFMYSFIYRKIFHLPQFIIKCVVLGDCLISGGTHPSPEWPFHSSASMGEKFISSDIQFNPEWAFAIKKIVPIHSGRLETTGVKVLLVTLKYKHTMSDAALGFYRSSMHR